MSLLLLLLLRSQCNGRMIKNNVTFCVEWRKIVSVRPLVILYSQFVWKLLYEMATHKIRLPSFPFGINIRFLAVIWPKAEISTQIYGSFFSPVCSGKSIFFSILRSYHIASNASVEYIGQCPKNVSVKSNKLSPHSHIQKHSLNIIDHSIFFLSISMGILVVTWILFFVCFFVCVCEARGSSYILLFNLKYIYKQTHTEKSPYISVPKSSYIPLGRCMYMNWVLDRSQFSQRFTALGNAFSSPFHVSISTTDEGRKWFFLSLRIQDWRKSGHISLSHCLHTLPLRKRFNVIFGEMFVVFLLY